MTFADMTSKLSICLADRHRDLYGLTELTAMLNEGQLRAITLLNSGLIPELDQSALAQTLDNDGAFDLEDLDPEPYGGIVGIRYIRLTNGRWFTRISYEEYRTMYRNGDTFPATDPVYYQIGTKLYMLPSTTTIDIIYRSAPAAITSSVNCALNTILHDIVVGLALEDYIDASKQAVRAYTNAMNKIERLNADYPDSESVKYGKLRDSIGLTGYESVLTLSGL